MRWPMVPLAGLLALFNGTAFGGTAMAQEVYPSRNITIIVPASAGGPADVLARIIGEQLKDSWGQPVIVENRAGANSMLGARAVAAAPPDG